MKVLILGGFLGSGKTTLLLQIAKDLAAHAPKNKPCKVMILENEIGQEGVDDKWIKSNGFSVESLFDGCICCSLAGEIVPVVSNLEKEYDPAWLIVETTGLAYPDLIRDNLQEALHLSSVLVTVVDVSRWNRFKMPMHELLKGQIACADILLLNKKDQVTLDVLEQVTKEVRDLAHHPQCFATSGVVPLEEEVLSAIREVIG